MILAHITQQDASVISSSLAIAFGIGFVAGTLGTLLMTRILAKARAKK